MELEGSFFDDNAVVVNMNPIGATSQLPPITGSVTLQIEHWERRLRSFNINPPQVLYRHQLPERSQSSLSYANDNQLACSMTNKLGVQQGIVQRKPKCSQMDEPITLTDRQRKRRSRSADSRLSSGCTARSQIAEKTSVDRSKMPSTSRASRQQHQAVPRQDIKIQINGQGAEI